VAVWMAAQVWWRGRAAVQAESDGGWGGDWRRGRQTPMG
jgi:hypothetical protein